MKRLLLTILALVAMTAGAWAQTDYGFSIMGIGVNSSNYQSLSSGKAWSYDPAANVLHLKEGTLWKSDTPIITVYGNINPTLIIQVDGNCKFEGSYPNGIDYHYNGHLTICGNGTLTMESSHTNPQYIVTSSSDDVSMTIKDVTINMTAYGTSSVGVLHRFSSIYLDNCEMNIKTYGGQAWTTVGQTMADIVFNKCFAYGGYITGGTFYDGTSVAQEAYIKRTINSVSVTVEAPQIGNTPSSNIVTDSEDYYASIVEWYAGAGWKLPDDYIFSEGGIYKVSFLLKPTEGHQFWNKKDEVTAYVNGHRATITGASGGLLIVQYIFPVLTDTYEDTYDLWIAGIQVTKQNKNNLAELVAELSEEAMERYFEGDMEITYDDASQTLTLKNAIIYAATGYGIQSKLSSPKIKLIGDNTITADNGMGVRLQPGTGASDGAIISGGGSLNIKASGVGLRSHLNLFLTDGVKITSEGDAIGFQGWKATSSDDPLPTLTMTGPETMLRTKGTREGSFANYGQLNLQDDIRIMQPSGATFVPNIGIVNNNQLVTDEWVLIAKPARGDVNLDGTVDIADVTAVLTAMANGSHDPQYRVNDDEVVDIADVTAILTIMAGQ